MADESAQKKALILMADGSEDIEVAVPAYIFRLGGMKTIIASSEGKEYVPCYQDIKVKSDMSLEEARKEGPFDVIFLPGGFTGAPNLADNEMVGEVLKEQEKANGVVGAICYSPAYSLTKYEIYKGKKITCYPDKVKQMILDKKTHTHVEEGIVEDGQLFTAQGPAFVIGISIAIVKKVCGEDKAKEVSSYMLLGK